MSLSDRIKRYEAVYKHALTPRSCLIIRVDGRAFHTFTRGSDKPFDQNIIHAMVYATEQTAKDMQGFKLAYTQSDEATFLLTDFDDLDTQGWFGYDLNKVVSISASLFTAFFNDYYQRRNSLLKHCPLALFDSRAFIVPVDDAPNVFVWRQRDWERNSLQMFARSFFSHKELIGKSTYDIHEMLNERGKRWSTLTEPQKYGIFIDRYGGRFSRKLNYEIIAGLIAPDVV